MDEAGGGSAEVIVRLAQQHRRRMPVYTSFESAPLPARCINQADRVETVFAAAPGLSIQLEVLSEFSEPGNSLKKDLSNVAHSATP
jgi:hypothetical protein